MPFESVLDLVGWTLLVRLHLVVVICCTPVYATFEFMNPGGTIGLKLAMAAASKGYH
jgi:cysteine synthase